MADFALWIVACERKLGWAPGTFLTAYSANRAAANADAIEESVIGPVLQIFLARCHASWEGTATELLEKLNLVADERTRSRGDRPRFGRGLSGDLRRIAPHLRATGVDVRFSRGRRRIISFRRGAGGDHAGDAPLRQGGPQRSDDSSPGTTTVRRRTDARPGRR